MTLGELNLKERLWVIPRERSKNAKAHEVSLSQPALDILDMMIKLRAKFEHLEASPFVFTSNGTAPVAGLAKAKERLDLEGCPKMKRPTGFTSA
jgi:integrase